MGVNSFTQFSLYCKHVLRKHFPADCQHLKTRVDTKWQNGRKSSVLVISDGEKEVSLTGTLEEWYERYQTATKLREVTDEMVRQCVQMMEENL